MPLLFSFQAFLPLPSIRPCNVSRPAGLITRIILLFFPGFVQFSSPIGPIRQKDHRETCKVFAGFKVNFSFVSSNTPACAGKTQSCYCRAAWSRAHPRLRGEDPTGITGVIPVPGSPPLARGRLSPSCRDLQQQRLTPACAGKTGKGSPRRAGNQAHPRLRGEDQPSEDPGRCQPGSPPLARGRLRRHVLNLVDIRLTPACAGKTSCSRLRLFRQRLTPACAGKTGSQWSLLYAFRAHPRLRGEDTPVSLETAMICGSPPLARGRLVKSDNCLHRIRLTPACAGKTETAMQTKRLFAAHPRLRGEDPIQGVPGEYREGSPPLARGRLADPASIHALTRLTPACAGKTIPQLVIAGPAEAHPRLRGEDSEL